MIDLQPCQPQMRLCLGIMRWMQVVLPVLCEVIL